MANIISAQALMDEILIATVIDKRWDYRRIASFSAGKQLEILKELQKKFDHPDINSLILQLEKMIDEIDSTEQ